jgi:MerR family copper efflux transcriptional regulator
MDMTIGSLAKRAKVNLQTLRYYEQFGLLAPVRHPSSGYRLYNEDSLRRLKFIRHAQAYGFSLKKIGTLLKLKALSPSDCKKACRMAEAKVHQIGQEIEKLEQMAKSLDRLVRESANRKGKGPCPVLQRFYGPSMAKPEI